MERIEEKEKVEQEEQNVAPPDVALGTEMKQEDRDAMEAIRKYTEEDEDDLGEISVRSILGGDFLMSKFMVKQIMFVMFCVLLIILYTGNRYDSQQDAILIDSLRGHLQEVKYNVLTQSSELMNLTRQSNVERMLSGTPDSLLHNSITPPYLLKREDGRVRTEEKKVEEVLVDPAVPTADEDEDDEGQEEQPAAQEAGAEQKKDVQPETEQKEDAQ